MVSPGTQRNRCAKIRCDSRKAAPQLVTEGRVLPLSVGDPVRVGTFAVGVYHPQRDLNGPRQPGRENLAVTGCADWFGRHYQIMPVTAVSVVAILRRVAASGGCRPGGRN
jgi:hypothetical protein